MRSINKFEKEKLLNLLECKESDLDLLLKNYQSIDNNNDYSLYDSLLKILQQGYNIREATLSGILLGQKMGYQKAKTELEDEIKDKLYRAFKNSK
tara:strand:- start:229 stop:513 length:285 start_codon:yes stop_codon:yes gene_type:complete